MTRTAATALDGAPSVRRKAVENSPTLAAGTTISAGTLAMKSVNESGARLSGVFPAEQHEDWVRNAAHIRRLAKLAERVAELEKKLKENDTRG